MTVRLGVIGVGWWACFNHIPTAQEHADAEVVALADLDSERLEKAGDHFGIANRYDDYRQMLANEALDGVMVATPHVAHTEPAIAALEHGCHVLVEKPMTTSTADAHALLKAAREAGREVLVPCGWNFREPAGQAADWVASGRIGEIEHVVCQMATPLEDLFAGEPMIETAEHMFRPPPSTWADPKRAGGYGWGQLSHALAWIYRITELAPVEVFCMTGQSRANVDYFDAAVVRMTNGATMALSGSATLPKHAISQLDVRVFGTEGMLLFDIERERLEVKRRDGEDLTLGVAPGTGAYDGTVPVVRFIEICRGKSAANDADVINGVRVVETLDALYRSAASGKPERVEAGG